LGALHPWIFSTPAAVLIFSPKDSRNDTSPEGLTFPSTRHSDPPTRSCSPGPSAPWFLMSR